LVEHEEEKAQENLSHTRCLTMIFLRALRVSFVLFVTPKAFESKVNSNGGDQPRIVVPGLRLDFDSPPAIFAGEDFNRKTLEPQETLSQGSHVVPEWLQLECGARASSGDEKQYDLGNADE
jgi:hypothetical protein